MVEAHEIRAIVAEVLAEQKRLHNDEVDVVSLKTMSHLLTSFGIEEEDRAEMRLDFQHLRGWRKSVEQAQGYIFKIIVTAIFGGLIGAIWLGIKMAVGKA